MKEHTPSNPPHVNRFMPDTVPTVEKNVVPPGSPLSIKIIPERLSNVTCCPTATAALARSPVFESPLLLVLPCKRWGCEVCRSQKIRALAFNIHAAAPNRLLTLTVDTEIDPNPEVAWLNTRDKPSELFRALRARKMSIEYLKVTEVTKKGYPHYHCLLRSDYLPQPVIKALWTRLTKSSIVDIRIVTNQFNAFSYLVKYLSKIASLEWTDRHVSYSRKFFPVSPSQTDWENDISTKITRRIDEHPYAYLTRFYYRRELTRLSPYRWLLNDYPTESENQVDYATLNIRKPTTEPTPMDKWLPEF